ncbi:MAG: preprotein translocase subunit SecD [Halobacteriota archaeon]
MNVRENWRIILLVVVLLASTFALFSPTLADDSATGATAANGTDVTATDGMTNLKFGLQLSGGTRIRAPLVGVTAENVVFEDTDPAQVERDVADQLEGVTAADVTARPPGQYDDVTQEGATVEVLVEGTTTDELSAALDEAGYAHGNVRLGVTDVTVEQTVEVLGNKINEAGLSGGTVQRIESSTGGRDYVLLEVPNRNTSSVIDLVDSRGTVRVDVYHPVEENGTRTYQRDQAVLRSEDFQNIGTATEFEDGTVGVPLSVRPEAAERFQDKVVETGVAQPGGSRCMYMENPNATDPCLLLVVDGDVVNAFGMDPTLASSMQGGTWSRDPSFRLTTRNFSESQELAINLRAGSLPAKLDIGPGGGGTSSFVSPTQGQSFRTDSLLTGIIAVLAVSGVVFLRYGEVRVAAPMVVTALSEVVILLGFAAGIGYPLDLSVIAGFIAVIGTGVDDLIIIADEVMQEGDVQSRRVFQSRFRKAFWVIGAAAATTIIAMSPLAVLSLGDLQGFAIFTILGVIVGVLLTRPAYGDILRMLLTTDR